MRPFVKGLLTRSSLSIALGVAIIVAIGSSFQFAARVFKLRDQRAAGPNWGFPSRVFSDGVPLIAGNTVPEAYLRSHLLARGYLEERTITAAPGRFARTADGFDIVLRGFLDEADPQGGGGPERVIVHLADGRIVSVDRLGGIPGAAPPDSVNPPRLEPVLVSMLFDDERMWRMRVSLERIPDGVRQAIVTSEDRRFFGHGGIDFRSAFRALAVNVRRGEIKQGGSTITQQLARGLFLGRERTVFRKFAEIPLAFGLEVLLSKDQILEMYLNSVYWGQADGGYSIGGIATAAQWYFDAPVESLNVVEGATLAAMIPAPNVYDPFKDPETVRERRNAVLEALEETRRLPKGTAAKLATLPLGLRRGRTPAERFPSYTSYVNHVLDDLLHRHAAANFGLSIFTTMDLVWQEQAEREMEKGLARMDSRRGPNRLEGAFVAIEPSRSAVLALVGGRSVKTGEFNRAFQARRQTGSAIKPFVYAAAFASPLGYTPATVVPDTQHTYGRGRWAWRPRNFDGTYHVEVTLAKALEKSLNVATTYVVEQIGPRRVAEVAAEFGLGALRPVMSIGLGSNEVTPLQLTNAFAAFASDGLVHEPSPLRIVLDRLGRKVAGPSEESVQAIPSGIASLMLGLLQNVVRYGVANPLRSVYGFDRPVGGKTGTSNDFHDAWFVGLTPHVAAGVWVGYDKPRSIGRAAAQAALPLWARTMGAMLEGFPATPFATERSLTWVDMDPWRGCLADTTGPSETTPFLSGMAPAFTCLPDELLYSDGQYWEGDSYPDSAYGEWAADDTSAIELGPEPEPESDPYDTVTTHM